MFGQVQACPCYLCGPIIHFMDINIYLACLFAKTYALDNIFCKAASARSVCSWPDRPKSACQCSITLAGTASSAQGRLCSQKTELPRFTA